MENASTRPQDPPVARPRRRFRALRIAGIVVAVLVVTLSGVFFAYVSDFSRATPTAVAALSSDDAVQVVEVASGYAFVPLHAASTIGLVVYPGGKVDEKAYAPLCRALAEAGWPVALVRMPFKLAVFGIDLGDKGIADLEAALTAAGKPVPRRYVAAGHSLGGVMAARFALTEPARFAGVVFWAAYSDQDLEPAGFAALTIFGSEDGVLDLSAVEKARANLPDDATTVVIAGGNHAGFGDYGLQKGDGTATIPGAQQRAETVDAMKSFLEGLVGAGGPGMNPESQGIYTDALKKGKKDRAHDLARGGTGRLADLETRVGNRTIVARIPLHVRDIPARLVCGTVSQARAIGFSPSFLPLMETRTEFASKWMHLCEAHMAEGFHTPVKLVEYLGRFYAEEGNKRVSVLKYYHVHSVRAEIVRWVPEFDASDPDIRLYYEFLEFHRRTGMYAVRLTTPGRYDELYDRLCTALGDCSPETYRRFEAAEFEAFRRVLHGSAGIDPRYSSGDILLAYLRLFGMWGKDEEDLVASRLKQLGEELRTRREPETEHISVEPGKAPAPPGGGLLGSLLGTPRALRVGFCYAKTPETSLWTRVHEEGRLEAIASLGARVETVVRSDVPEGLGAAEAISEFAGQGFDVVFATTPAMLAPTLRASIDHPGVRFYCCSEAHPYMRVETYFGRMYEARFLLGIVAGSLSRTGRIGAVATWPVPDVVSGLNAFVLGVRTVDPDAEVLVEWTKDWESHSRTAMLRQERRLLDAGVDLISRQSTLGGRGLVMGTGLSWSEESGSRLQSIAAPRWKWGIFYERILRQILSEGPATPLDRFLVKGSTNAFWWGIGSGLVDLELDETRIPEPTRRLVHWMRALLVEGRLHPFSGPLLDNEGVQRVAAGVTPGFDEISSMDWFVEGIRTQAPVMEQDQAEDVTR